MIPSFNPLPLKEEEETCCFAYINFLNKFSFNPLPLKEEEETKKKILNMCNLFRFQSASS
ncbi:hypothetical protein LEP1GSC132_3870 [Leptospira kirschneri str. 200803703]|uniref:hypothetical protein n=1 Tax=Leptospira kirschneri TaxID=29507 RepID=UPI0002C004BC|nr:hypothetical protein LEP1GSC132_3870 [Leptospira kirschneri str. 200803703]